MTTFGRWLRRIFQLLIFHALPVNCNLFNFNSFSDIHSIIPLFAKTKL